MQKSNKQSSFLVEKNIYLLIVFSILMLVIYTVRLYYYQIIKGEYFRQQSEHNRTRIEEIPAPRGLIYDRNGRLLVENRPAFHIYMVPEKIDVDKIARNISGLCNLPFDEIMKNIEKHRKISRFKPFRVFSDISRDCLAKIEANRFKLPGVFIGVEPVRFYCYGHAAAHLLGYLGEVTDHELKSVRSLGYQIGDWIGKSGLEKVLESYLRGYRGLKVVEVDALGRRLRTLDEKLPIPGHAVWLTVDIDLQRYAESVMKDLQGAVVVMDVNTGAIRAMVSSPGFDPNIFVAGLTSEEWRELNRNPGHPLLNRAVQSAYPPGSTFKPFVAFAGLEEGVIKPSTTFYCPGFYKLGRRSYRCWKRGGHGHLGLHRAIVESCDVYFYQLGLKLGVDKIAHYVKLFGLGSKTNIGLPGERKGLIPTSEWKLKNLGQPWQMGETLSVAIGQGYVLATPLQMAVAYAAIANNGWRLKPYIVERIEGTTVHDFGPEKTRLPFGSYDFKVIKSALEDVVKNVHGTAHRIWDEDLPVAGKTGTAQVVKLRERTKKQEDIPWHFRDHAWFVGYAPSNKPEIVVAVIVEHGGHGSSAAAPVVKKIIDFYFGKKR